MYDLMKKCNVFVKRTLFKMVENVGWVVKLKIDET